MSRATEQVETYRDRAKARLLDLHERALDEARALARTSKSLLESLERTGASGQDVSPSLVASYADALGKALAKRDEAQRDLERFDALLYLVRKDGE